MGSISRYALSVLDAGMGALPRAAAEPGTIVCRSAARGFSCCRSSEGADDLGGHRPGVDLTFGVGRTLDVDAVRLDVHPQRLHAPPGRAHDGAQPDRGG